MTCDCQIDWQTLQDGVERPLRRCSERAEFRGRISCDGMVTEYVLCRVHWAAWIVCAERIGSGLRIDRWTRRCQVPDCPGTSSVVVECSTWDEARTYCDSHARALEKRSLTDGREMRLWRSVL